MRTEMRLPYTKLDGDVCLLANVRLRTWPEVAVFMGGWRVYIDDATGRPISKEKANG